MRVKKIPDSHHENCRMCKTCGFRRRAVWRATLSSENACNDHLPILREWVDDMNRIGAREHTEADYQTWMRA